MPPAARAAPPPRPICASRPRRLSLTRIADALDQVVREKEMKNLLLVAPPGALGVLRGKLSPSVRGVISGEVAKSLTGLPVDQIARHLLTG
ncbi:host attachment protein [Roseococcus sp.]|uniref:host attachment protein n=1 Tax=Roseococcus sp. TaxID=2109646 RepID=UPI003BAD605E